MPRIKLKNLLCESKLQNYQNSVMKSLSGYNISKKNDKDSNFITFEVKDSNGNQVGEFSRFISNNQINQLDGFIGEVYDKILTHDSEFARKNRLKLRY